MAFLISWLIDMVRFFSGHFSLFVAVMSVAITGAYLWLIEILKSRVTPNKMCANPVRFDNTWLFIRLLQVVFGIPIIILGFLLIVFGEINADRLLSMISSTTDVVAIYLIACTPKPWTGSFAGRFAEMLSSLLFGRLVRQS